MATLNIRLPNGTIERIPLVHSAARPALHIRGGGFDGNIALLSPSDSRASHLRVRVNGAVYAVQRDYSSTPTPPPPPTPPPTPDKPTPFFTDILGMYNQDETHYDLKTGRKLLGTTYGGEERMKRVTIPTPVSNVYLSIESGATGLWMPGGAGKPVMRDMLLLEGTGSAAEMRNPYTMAVMECSSSMAKRGMASLLWVEKNRFGYYPAVNQIHVNFNPTSGNVPSFRISCYRGAHI